MDPIPATMFTQIFQCLYLFAAAGLGVAGLDKGPAREFLRQIMAGNALAHDPIVLGCLGRCISRRRPGPIHIIRQVPIGETGGHAIDQKGPLFNG